MQVCRVGIALGDVTGIGPEVTLKALATEPPDAASCRILIGDADQVHVLARQLGLSLELSPYHEVQEAGRIYLLNAVSRPLSKGLSCGAPEAARAAFEWVKAGAELCLRGELEGLVTAPVNKEAIVRSGIPFVGQTELLSQLAGTERTAMMLLGQDERGRWLRVALATTHLALKSVSSRLTQSKVETVIELAAAACRDLRLTRQRIAVCGLNPHAGEGGQMGLEEIEIIAPAVVAAQRRGLDVVGPLSADALFYHAYRAEYDAVVAMYHDQGLGPLKMVAFEQGVNWTLGLPFVRTSPDHGTAYDIAGRNRASPSSMLAALRLARQLAGSRMGRQTA
ncbi:MAG TPA: 4-hydroxythreonine-4-phosphate dehydrogenase PdxA [Verrucomicrobiae bacterium]